MEMIAFCLMIRKVKLNLQIKRGGHSVCPNTSSRKDKSTLGREHLIVGYVCRGGGTQGISLSGDAPPMAEFFHIDTKFNE